LKDQGVPGDDRDHYPDGLVVGGVAGSDVFGDRRAGCDLESLDLIWGRHASDDFVDVVDLLVPRLGQDVLPRGVFRLGQLGPLRDVPLRAMTPGVVREWYAAALRGTGGRASIAQSYRFLHAVMNTALRDGAITKNPCQIRGAGSDRAKERPVATPTQVATLIEAITPRYRAAVLRAAWCGLRRGEVLGLHPADVDLTAGTVTVRRNRIELPDRLRLIPPRFQVPRAFPCR
jgi:hypothetical protein